MRKTTGHLLGTCYAIVLNFISWYDKLTILLLGKGYAMEYCYEEYSDDNLRRYRVYKDSGFFRVILEEYHAECVCMGYIEPEGFYEIRDNMVHHVGTIDEGISVGRELLRNI